MFSIGPLGFVQPVFLLLLILLPILWWLLHAVPPAPVVRKFPAVGLLIGLKDEESQTDRTPWWLLLLRLLALALAIVAFAGPLLNPAQSNDTQASNLLIISDDSWPMAPTWAQKQERLNQVVQDASQRGDLVAYVSLTDIPQTPIQFETAESILGKMPSMKPLPWAPDDAAARDRLEAFAQTFTDPVRIVWMSDGLAREGRDALLSVTAEMGDLRVFDGSGNTYALAPARFEAGIIYAPVMRKQGSLNEEVIVKIVGPDPSGIDRILAQSTIVFEDGEDLAEATFELPPQLRNRITQFQIDSHRSAGAVSLVDDALRRREVALFSAESEGEALALLNPLHYLHQALVPTADLLDGAITETVLARPDVIILADVAQLSDGDGTALEQWVTEGGLLVRFAGPRLAASDLSRQNEDPLMPVRLRQGGRSIGGAMSWGSPRTLREFPVESPFFGLQIPEDVVVRSQVVAEPDPSLASRVLASLEDGTPLVTRKELGEGQVVLFHVTASAQWSTLPLSGLFVQMMERLAISTRADGPRNDELIGTYWTPLQVLDGFGQLSPSPSSLSGIRGEAIVEDAISAILPPGLYINDERQIARNVFQEIDVLHPQTWPTNVKVVRGSVPQEQSLKGTLLGLSLVALLLDAVASLWVSGRFRRGSRATLAVLGLTAIVSFGLPIDVAAQDQSKPVSDKALAATSEVVMAYVITGDAQVDEVSRAGLWGLGKTLHLRTSIEPADPIAVDLEVDELSFYPMIYWPITATQPLPTPAAYERLNRYLQKGGLILFDTRDADEQRFKKVTENTRRLRTLARQLSVPPLEEIPLDHILNRSFYLLQQAPGRYVGPPVWVEAAPADAVQAEGMPFRNLNDGVTPVVIGANDWASAWAMAPNGNRLYTVGRGRGGERQREMAFRFGVNLMMHVLTGNYKSDQVHVPELLKRLGQ